jgi:hypothetical protein
MDKKGYKGKEERYAITIIAIHIIVNTQQQVL